MGLVSCCEEVTNELRTNNVDPLLWTVSHSRWVIKIASSDNMTVAPGFKDKTRYTPYVSPGSQISHIAINKGNINRQCLNT